jgi:hypothetical protein
MFKLNVFALAMLMFLVGMQHSAAQGTMKLDTLKYWDFNGNFGITFNQVSFINWAKGGENSISGTSFANLFANYTKNKWEWNNYLLLSYGVMRQGESDESFRKTEDRIELNSKLGYKQWTSLFWTFNMNFKTQFAPGYYYPNDTDRVSEFLSPAYLIMSLGLDYKASQYLSLFFSPMTGKFNYVKDTIYSQRYGIAAGEHLRPDFGWYFTAGFKHDSVWTNVGIATKLTLFQNYTDPNVKNRKNIDVDWQAQFLFKINNWLSAMFKFHLLYDNDIQVPIYETINGEKTQIGTGPRTQFMEQFGLGIVYKFE